MGEIYRYAVCNIAVESGINCEAGLYHRGSLTSGVGRLNNIQIFNRAKSSYIAIPTDYVEYGLLQCPLRHRGWVCQERLLATRQISFAADEVFWTCLERRATEMFPGHSTGLESVVGYENPDCQMTELIQRHMAHPTHRVSDVGPRDSHKMDRIYEGWGHAVEVYTNCALTRGKDKLVALQGLIRELQPLLDDENIAGLWKKRLCQGLLWVSRGYARGSVSTRPAFYRAPSWSWASINGSVSIPVLQHSVAISDRRRCIEGYMAEILDVSVVPVMIHQTELGDDIDGEVAGQVSNGYIRLRGRLTSMNDSWRFRANPALERTLDMSQMSQYDQELLPFLRCIVDIRGDWKPKVCSLLTLWKDDEHGKRSCDGLVVTPARGQNDTFSRVGVFKANMEFPEEEERIITLI